MSERRKFLLECGRAAAAFILMACKAEKLDWPRELRSKSIGPTFFGHMVQGDWVLDDGSLCCPVTCYFGLLRLWDSRAVWWKMVADAAALEANLRYAERVGAQVMFTFGEPPSTACYPNSKVPLAAAWTQFVRDVVTQSAGRIKYWELWNEPGVAGYWSGTVEQLAAQSAVAYQIIKEIEPGAIVLSPSMTELGLSRGVQFADRYLSAGGGNSCDVIAFHSYPQTPDELPLEIATLRSVMLMHGVDKPIWNTEFALVPPDPSLRSEWMERSFRLQAEAGICGAVWNAEIPGAEDYNDDTMQGISEALAA
ncbi:MAG: glycosyl hydrolase [Gemmatimonadaceae bacterium]